MYYKPKFKELLAFHSDMINSLSFTPEVWLIDRIENAGCRTQRWNIKRLLYRD